MSQARAAGLLLGRGNDKAGRAGSYPKVILLVEN